MEIDLSKYEDLDIKELMTISEVRERVMELFYEEIPLEPFEKILTHHGVNLNEETSY